MTLPLTAVCFRRAARLLLLLVAGCMMLGTWAQTAQATCIFGLSLNGVSDVDCGEVHENATLTLSAPQGWHQTDPPTKVTIVLNIIPPASSPDCIRCDPEEESCPGNAKFDEGSQLVFEDIQVPEYPNVWTTTFDYIGKEATKSDHPMMMEAYYDYKGSHCVTTVTFEVKDVIGPVRLKPGTLNACENVVASVTPTCSTKIDWAIACKYPLDMKTTGIKLEYDVEPESPTEASHSCIIRVENPEEVTSGLIMIKATPRDSGAACNQNGANCYSEAKLGVNVDSGSCSGEECDNKFGGGENKNGSIQVRMYLGHNAHGEPVGQFLLHKQSADSISMDQLQIVGNDEYLGIKRVSSLKRQVKVRDGLAEIVDNDSFAGGSFKVKFYTNDEAGSPSGGDYSPGTPFRIWSFNDDVSGVFLRVDDGAGGLHDYTYSSTSPVGWTLTQRDSSSTVVKTASRTDNQGSPIRTETYHVKNVDGSTAYKEESDYDLRTSSPGYSWGNALIEKRVKLADGSSLTTTYKYHDFPTASSGTADYGRHGRIKRITYPDGSWILYDYDAESRTTLELRSWLDVTAPDDVSTPNAARATEYVFTALDTNEGGSLGERPRSPRTVIEKVLGTVVSKTYHAYYRSATSPNVMTEIEERAASNTASYSDGDTTTNLRTVTVYNARNAVDGAADEVQSITYPDGRKDTYSYDLGTYTPATPNDEPGSWSSTGTSHLRVALAHGTTGSTEGVANKTTQEVTTRTTAGRPLLEETNFYAGSSTYTQIHWKVSDYDDQLRLVAEYSNNNEIRTIDPGGCCGLASETDATGTKTEYTYDDLYRLVQVTKKGFEANGSDDLLTVYTLDAMGRRLTETKKDGAQTVSLSTEHEYDWSGRVTEMTDPADLVTGYEYVAPGVSQSPQTILTRPGGAEEITTYYLDGRVKSITGDGVVHKFHEYGINSGDGSQWTKVYNGPDLDESPMWIKTTSDVLGRMQLEEKPGWASSTVTTAYEYWSDNSTNHSHGQLKKTTTTGQDAPTVYEYDSLGNVIRTGLDVDGSADVLDAASNDRITETDASYVTESSAWWEKTTAQVYATPNNGTPTLVSTQKRRLTGFETDVIEQTISLDVLNNPTTTTVEVDRNAKQVTRTIDHPDSDADEATVTINGLLESTTSRTGLTTTYTYDVLGRQTLVTDPRTGSSETHYNSDGQVDWTEDAADNRTEYAYYDENNIAAGRLKSITDPADKTQYFSYNARGEQTRTWGERAYPVEYGYDDYGRRITMKTYRGDPVSGSWESSSWPGDPGTADTTTWTYEEEAGLLEEKVYADNNTTQYTYTDDGKLETRTWARTGTIVTTYSYDADTGELTGVDYSDSTPDVTFAYNRLGQKKTVTDGVGTWTFTYNAALQPYEEIANNSPATGLYRARLAREYATSGPLIGRSEGFTLGTEQETSAYEVTYAYDSAGRLETLTGTALPAGGVVYERIKDGSTVVNDAVEYIRFKDGSANTLLQTQRKHETTRDLIDFVENKAGASLPTVSKYDYTNDAVGRRKDVVHTGSAFTQDHLFKWGYNTRSELTTADRHEGTDPANPGTQYTTNGDFVYAYDPIGNRDSYTLDNGTPTTYTDNPLNQYTQTSNPSESFEYDEDGNLIQDGTFDYTWDAENRLIEVVKRIDLGASQTAYENGDVKVEFKYDHMSRRVEKKVRYYNNGWPSTPLRDHKFIYDGWNVILVLDGNDDNATLQKYTWGLDLSGLAGAASEGGIHGAGGVGGLLGVVETTGTPAGTYWFFHDANGNVVQVIQNNSGYSTDARYQYDPYGNLIASAGGYANVNPFRFSTKWFDAESGLNYYGYRYYMPRDGRWLNRDPADEQGSRLNTYQFVFDSPMTLIDPLGLDFYLLPPKEKECERIPGTNKEICGQTWADPAFEIDGLHLESCGKGWMRVAWVDVITRVHIWYGPGSAYGQTHFDHELIHGTFYETHHNAVISELKDYSVCTCPKMAECFMGVAEDVPTLHRLLVQLDNDVFDCNVYGSIYPKGQSPHCKDISADTMAIQVWINRMNRKAAECAKAR